MACTIIADIKVPHDGSHLLLVFILRHFILLLHFSFLLYQQSGKSNYAIALADIRKVKERGRQATGVMSQSPAPLDTLLSHLCEQLEHYIDARKDMMDLYPLLLNPFFFTTRFDHPTK